MTELPAQVLSEHEAVDQIAETIQQADAGDAPFALVLGSGFSFGLVPTAREVVTESLPLWMKGLTERDADETAEESFERQKKQPAAERTNIAIAFWEKFLDRNASRNLQLSLGSHGLPEDYAAAYQSAFSPKYTGAVGEPMQARKFQRALMRLTQPRLNAAHFLLASILGVQPGKQRKSILFKARAALSRLILTTNFDPFLQTALQSANRLYFMSDTPELGVTDEVFDDQTDAIHLVYVHGSIHRRSQIASEGDVKRLKEKNAQILAPVLKRHGVIVLGYSGWDDAIVEALVACDSFDHRLYWCGIERDPFTKGAFGPCVPDILRKPSACYVTTTGAGQFMAQLCTHLVHRLPRLLSNPIEQVREMLETIDLSELRNLEPVVQAPFADSPLPAGGADRETFYEACSMTIQRLKETEDLFRVGRQSFCHVLPNDPTSFSAGPGGENLALKAYLSSQTEEQTRQFLSSAKLAEALGNYAEALKLCEQALALPEIKAPDQGELQLLRGRAHYFLGRIDDAVNDWSQLIELPGASVEQIAKALNNRGLAWGRQGEIGNALADYAQVIDNMPNVPVEQVAVALRARGEVLLQANRIDEALSSYTRIIEALPGAPIEQVAKALTNRAVVWEIKNQLDKAQADYTQVIEHLPGAPVQQIAIALNNRAVAWETSGQPDKAMADYTRIIDGLPEASVEQIAIALINRGVAQERRDQPDKAMADYARLIDNFPGAPAKQIAVAFGNRGWMHYRRGNFVAFLADTEQAASIFPHLDFVAFNLGFAFFANGQDAAGIEAYRRAAKQFPDKIIPLGLQDLEEAQETGLIQKERAELAIQLLQSLMQP